MFKLFLHEPLIHFILIGGLIFLLYSFQNEGISDQDTRIVFNQSDISRLVSIWKKKRQRPPTKTELDSLIEQQIREAVMYREALKMGLDKSDPVVRRRLAQKIEFISADLAEQVEPTQTELIDYLTTHSKQFETPARISFVQVYLNPDRTGNPAQQEAVHLLKGLPQISSGPDSDFDLSTIGDSLMLNVQYQQLSEFYVSRLFGADFAKRIFDLPVGRWQGPVNSGYGLHLIRIDSKTQAELPALQQVKNKVRSEWMNQQRNVVDEAFYQSLRQQYEIVIDDFNMSEK